MTFNIPREMALDSSLKESTWLGQTESEWEYGIPERGNKMLKNRKYGKHDHLRDTRSLRSLEQGGGKNDRKSKMNSFYKH